MLLSCIKSIIQNYPLFQSAWGHSNAEHKRVVSAMWTPPEWDNGEIEFV